jgi:hypothetical protein
MRKLGAWLGIAAIALQIAWPLLAGAQPRAVTLVPLCTVDGVTHYLEVPTGKAPSDSSSTHGDHCPLCFLGERAAMAVNFTAPILIDGPAEHVIGRPQALLSKFVRQGPGARAPPYSPRSAV